MSELFSGYTAYQAKYFANFLTREGIGADEALTQSLSSARVDLNPHQVDAAMFALRSPLSKGVLLADEVGLGKTIEACLTLHRMLRTGRASRALILVPESLLYQWFVENWYGCPASLNFGKCGCPNPIFYQFS